MNNYSKKKELEIQRLDMFDEGIALYNKGDFDSALIIFEEVAALEPKNYMANFETSPRFPWRSTTSRAASASPVRLTTLSVRSKSDGGGVD